MSELTTFQAAVLKALGDDELSSFQVALRLASPYPTEGRFLRLRQFLWMPPETLHTLWKLERDGLVTSRRDPDESGRWLYRRAGATNPR